MCFRIVGLDPARYGRLWSASDEELAQAGAQRVVVSGEHSAPCRISLDDAAPGECVILLSYEHQPNPTPYRQQGPIFVRERQQRFDRVGVIPPALARRTLSLRAFDGRHMMIGAEIVEGAEATPMLEDMLAEPKVAYIHAHFARRGCFAGLIERAA